ncbi:hypothetical protein BN1708_010332 [Verticillium longisporum]|uniref:Uncharacterized protein n=1 Tax=Verticillium longisporum TaxID=100787 RepID=A0A0G4KQR4_VERLO|nr:hypothetical protein BN1708_010332 [Verticillium longisporum]
METVGSTMLSYVYLQTVTVLYKPSLLYSAVTLVRPGLISYVVGGEATLRLETAGVSGNGTLYVLQDLPERVITIKEGEQSITVFPTGCDGLYDVKRSATGQPPEDVPIQRPPPSSLMQPPAPFLGVGRRDAERSSRITTLHETLRLAFSAVAILSLAFPLSWPANGFCS